MIDWTSHWRKQVDPQRMIEIVKEENLYQQEYYDYVYSLRDTTRWRLQNWHPRIEIGMKFFGTD